MHHDENGAASEHPLTHLLVGAIMQAGNVVARTDDPAAAKRKMAESFSWLLSSL